MTIVQFLNTGYAHTAALIASVVLGWFLTSGNPALTLTIGGVGKILYTDLVSFANS
ncbi:MAG TPA: hypothetical protein VKW08_00405 [Xanthobacteraceae bacterium]|nr:hypothetical protein [Xanthobacteraceae bacterium]